MKKYLLTLFAVVTLFPFALSAGEVVRLTRYLGERLTGVSAGFTFQVELISSPETRAVVEVPIELEQYLIFEKNAAGVVKVDMRIPNDINRRYSSGRYWDDNKLVLKLYTPTIEYISLTTATKGTATGTFTGDQVEIKINSAAKMGEINLAARHLKVNLEGASELKVNATAPSATLKLGGAGKLSLNLNGNNDLSIDISGAGKVDLNLPSNEKLTMNIGGAGHVALRGRGNTVKIDATSAAKIEAREFPARRVEVKAAAAANVTVNASEYLNITTSAASKVQYTGNPQEKIFNNPNINELR